MLYKKVRILVSPGLVEVTKLVLAHEVPVLHEVWPESVKVLSGFQVKDRPNAADPGKESQRLRAIYGDEAVQRAFGPSDAGLLAKAIRSPLWAYGIQLIANAYRRMRNTPRPSEVMDRPEAEVVVPLWSRQHDEEFRVGLRAAIDGAIDEAIKNAEERARFVK